MMLKKIGIWALLAVFLICGSSCAASRSVLMYDAAGNVFAEVADIEDLPSAVSDAGLISYADIVLQEAVEIIKAVKECDSAKAISDLRSGCRIYTALDPAVYAALSEHYDDIDITGTELGCVIANPAGNILATYSAGGVGTENYAAKKRNPCSAFKPLSVYAPALDAGLIHWSTQYEDSPYKQLRDENGNVTDWPQNGTEVFSMQNVCLNDAIRRSLNTVAVKCLADYGVNRSIAFLQQNLGIDLSMEQQKATLYGEEEIIGNIAMGYLSAGCSPLDMAGYYQIFANGGKYSAPGTVLKIISASGEVIFEKRPEAAQVIKPATACIMNRLLQGVVAEGGTGAKAQLPGIEVGGKTGTSIDNDGNWFVGFTPQYIGAFWHGLGPEKNRSSEIFAKVMADLVNDPAAQRQFPIMEGVEKQAFCEESGMLLRYSCHSMGMGYYAQDNTPPPCPIH